MTFWLAVISIVISLNSSFDLQGAFDSYSDRFSHTIYTNEVIETKTKNNLINAYGYIIINPYELITRQELYNNISTYLYNQSVGYTYNLSPYYCDNVVKVGWYQLNPNNPDNSVSNYGISLNSISYTLTHIVNSNGRQLQSWDVAFTYANGNIVYSIATCWDILTSGSTFVGATYIDLKSNTVDPQIFLCLRSSTYLYGLLNSINEDEYNNGYYAGYNEGYNEAYDQGVERGEEIASDPASEIYENTYNTGYNAGFQVGRAEGVADASASAGVPALIFTGILNVALLPVDIFLQMFQYEVFGINIAGLISGLLTVCMVIIIIRFLFGGKGGSKDD